MAKPLTTKLPVALHLVFCVLHCSDSLAAAIGSYLTEAEEEILRLWFFLRACPHSHLIKLTLARLPFSANIRTTTHFDC